MSRRTKPNPADGLTALVAKVPWWCGVALAALSFVLFRHLASQSMAPTTASGQVADMVRQGLWKDFATFALYVVPLLCLAGAAVSAWRAKERRALAADVAQSQASDVLDGMSWQEFERLVGEGFRLQGYQVSERGVGGADGGVDLVLRRPSKNGGEKYLVQCKQWRALKVGVDVVRELYGVMAAKGATGGFLVTSGHFTAEAIAFAEGRNVTLVDGPKLIRLIRQARTGAGHPVAQQGAASGATPPTATSAHAVLCPVCAKAMVRRSAKRGANAGSSFWGCAGYPTCRGTRPID